MDGLYAGILSFCLSILFHQTMPPISMWKALADKLLEPFYRWMDYVCNLAAQSAIRSRAFWMFSTEFA